jgi:hypothetical protein
MKPLFDWDNFSDQPHIIRNKVFKRQQKHKYLFEYLQMFLLFVFIFPMAFVWQFLMRFPKNKAEIGIGVNLDKGDDQYRLIEELGVKHLIVRMPLWEVDKVDEYVEFVRNFGNDKIILINILQDINNIKNKMLLQKNTIIIFDKFKHLASEYQIGNAINRTKWGFFSVSEYLNFYQTVQEIRDKNYPKLKLVGPSVIDFEYYYTTSALFNFKKIKFDTLSTLLYVDRRGSPSHSQYGFNLERKINLLASLASLSSKTNQQIYITETNWPLKNTAPFAPTSEKECVSEKTYSEYMCHYLALAKDSHKVKRIYWHQLIAPGYGLVDNRYGKIRKMPAFYRFKEIINE